MLSRRWLYHTTGKHAQYSSVNTIEQWQYQNDCTSTCAVVVTLAWQYQYGSSTMAASVRQHRYGSSSMAASVCQYRHGSFSMAAYTVRIAQYTYQHTSTSQHECQLDSRGVSLAAQVSAWQHRCQLGSMSRLIRCRMVGRPCGQFYVKIIGTITRTVAILV